MFQRDINSRMDKNLGVLRTNQTTRPQKKPQKLLLYIRANTLQSLHDIYLCICFLSCIFLQGKVRNVIYIYIKSFI